MGDGGSTLGASPTRSEPAPCVAGEFALGHTDFSVFPSAEVYPIPENAVLAGGEEGLGIAWKVPVGQAGGGHGLHPGATELRVLPPVVVGVSPAGRRGVYGVSHPINHEGSALGSQVVHPYTGRPLSMSDPWRRRQSPHRNEESMIIEDLFWVDDVTPMGLSSPWSGALAGEPLLIDSGLCDVRAVGVLDCVGILFDVRSCPQVAMWHENLDVIVLVVRGVSQCSAHSRQGRIVTWAVESDAGLWACEISVTDSLEKMECRGAAASLYGGVVPGLPHTHRPRGGTSVEEIRGWWPTWQSEFVLTTEPEHANPHLIPGSVNWERSFI